ncbi:SpoIIE family protein phosphatase [Pontibacterium granulatum]|uniref:PP2C family protein-serine/threonine phosphatase n=1 Tax=Pontibacterium granulatum TaxID=2036029 RepID=UPI00249B54A4|nr:SpoIIE family protein phosphatase [Pontibacterium granulatum]MDI3324433.1 SpoIIE family protein phosphatase [Pontibacterium granulatum]
MSLTTQKVLLVDHSTRLMDQIFDLLNESSIPDMRVSTSLSFTEAKEKLGENQFALLIVRTPEGKQEYCEELIRLHAPGPVLVLLDNPSSSEIFRMLRAGASDVFDVDSVASGSQVFLAAIERLFSWSRVLEQNRFYREELEQSLSELKADQQAAYHIQRNMMPAEEIDICGIKARHLIAPSLYLSGDFVDVVPVDEDRVVFYLADVSGHGASSALVTVLLKNMTQGLVRDYRGASSDQLPSLSEVLQRINAELLETGVGKHLSMFLGAVDRSTGLLHYAVGGHHPMPLLSDTQGTRYLQGRGMPIGLFEQPIYDERVIELEWPFQITLFSDGILEVLPQKDMLSREEFVRAVVDNLRGAPPEKLKQSLMANFEGEAPDDIAIMTVVGQ